MTRFVVRVLLLCGLTAAWPQLGLSQSRPSTGFGVQAGAPTGISVKIVRNAEPHYDLLAAWDLDDFLFLSANAVWERRVEDMTDVDLRMFYGPGAFIGFRDNSNDNVAVGIGGAVGASIWADRFEFFLQLLPRFELVSRTDFDIGGGIGVRFHVPRG